MSIKIDVDIHSILKYLNDAANTKGESEYSSGSEISDALGLSATKVNDAVDLLEDNDHVETIRTLGSAPYRFALTRITPRGKYEIQSQEAQDLASSFNVRRDDPVDPHETSEEHDLVELYRRIRTWYQANSDEIVDDESGFSEISKDLIRNLPLPEDATVLEMRAVMREVISGGMEWAYNNSDGQSTMSDYAKRAVEPFGGYTLSKEYDDQLRTSVLWSFLIPGRATYFRDLGEKYTREASYSEAETIIRRAFEDTNSDVDRFDLSLALGNLFLQMDRNDEALEQLQNTFKIGSDLNDAHRLIQVHTSLGKAFVKIQNNTIAESNFQTAVSIAEDRYRDDQLYRSIYRQTLIELRDFYIDTNNIEQAVRIRTRIFNFDSTFPSPPPPKTDLTHSTPKSMTDIFTQIDHLGYENFTRTIATLITHEETSLPLTIGIKAAWGAGKTSIMKMVQHILDSDAGLTQENEAIRRNRDQTSKVS